MESSQNENVILIDAEIEISFKWMKYAWWHFYENFQTKKYIA
jgi:hypothetical protein